jgi:hypothetical protein
MTPLQGVDGGGALVGFGDVDDERQREVEAQQGRQRAEEVPGGRGELVAVEDDPAGSSARPTHGRQMPEGGVADFVAAAEERRPGALDHCRVEGRTHGSSQRARVLVAPQRQAAQGALILGAVVELFVEAAVLHQQLGARRVSSRLRGAAEGVDLVAQRGRHLPTGEARRGVERAQPGGEARLQRGHAFLGGVQQDVERLQQEGFNVVHPRPPPRGRQPAPAHPLRGRGRR